MCVEERKVALNIQAMEWKLKKADNFDQEQKMILLQMGGLLDTNETRKKGWVFSCNLISFCSLFILSSLSEGQIHGLGKGEGKIESKRDNIYLMLYIAGSKSVHHTSCSLTS